VRVFCQLVVLLLLICGPRIAAFGQTKTAQVVGL